MLRVFALVAVVVLSSVAAAGVALGQSSATPSLKGTVGPGFTISLSKGGKKVKTLKAGRYQFAISDKSSIHDFTLERETGGKFEKMLTSTGFTGTKKVTVALKKGKWKYYCSVHEPSMFGFFKVK
jgi:hypothetical protein